MFEEQELEVRMVEGNLDSELFRKTMKDLPDLIRVILPSNLIKLGPRGGFAASQILSHFHRSYRDRTLFWFEDDILEVLEKNHFLENESLSSFMQGMFFSQPASLISLLVDEEKYAEIDGEEVVLPGFGLLHATFAAFPDDLMSVSEDKEDSGELVWDVERARKVLAWLVGLTIPPDDSYLKCQNSFRQIEEESKLFN